MLLAKILNPSTLLLILVAAMLQGCEDSSKGAPLIEVAGSFQTELRQPMDIGGISAPGFIEPLDGILRLSAPITPSGLAPRVAKLYVKAGDPIKKGQVLARFDNYPRLSQTLAAEDATIESLKLEIALLASQTQRFQFLESKGALSGSDLEEKQLRLIQLRNKLVLSQAKRQVILEELKLSELIAPISGLVLSIQARDGEQPSISEGVLDVADNSRIGAITQVDEKYIPRIRIGQAVLVDSENGYFDKPLEARIISIGSRVTYRRSLFTKPGFYKDAEPRVVDIQLEFKKALPERLAQMTGAKVVARFLES